MNAITVTRHGVEKLLLNLKVKKAGGPDEISARTLVETATVISTVVASLFQQSLGTGTVPNDWRSADVTPIFKKGK